MKKILEKCVLTLLVISFVGISHKVFSTTLIHRNLKELVVASERIFIGQCIAVQEGELKFPRGTIFYTEYTFQVSESIKGNVDGVITFKQYGLAKPRQIDENTVLYNRPVGMPVYNENEEYMLFLIGDSRLGLTSPVGLYQGAFLITQDQFGRQVALNGAYNRGLFKNMSSNELNTLALTRTEQTLAARAKGPFILNDFVSVVKKFDRSY